MKVPRLLLIVALANLTFLFGEFVLNVFGVLIVAFE